MTSYEYDGANQLLSMKSAEGLRTFKYDKSGRLVEELLDGKTVASYKYGYLDKVTEVNRNGKITKFKYDGFGMLAQKTFHDGKTEDWVWDGMALVMRGNDIYVNEPHVSGGTPLLTKTDKGVRYHTSDFLGTTLWSTDTRGKALDSYADTSVFGEGSIQQDRSARFTGKPYDEDLQAYVFPYRNYDPKLARWTSSDPSGFPDGINQHFYACNPTMAIDPWGLEEWGNLDFVVHYYTGNGSGVSLESIGLYEKVEACAFSQGVQSSFGEQISKKAMETASTSDSFNLSFRNSYNFGSVAYSIGNASMYGYFTGNITEVETLDNGMVLYSYSGEASVNFVDTFADPLSVIQFLYGSSTSPDAPAWLLALTSLGGTAYDIYGTYTWSYSGSFEK